MGVRPEVAPFIGAVLLGFGLLALFLRRNGRGRRGLLVTCGIPACIGIGYLLYFFRDPDRTPPRDANAIVAGADGTVAAIVNVHEGRYLKADCIRISIFLSLFDVHVNRAPISGKSTFLGYFPGKRLFTFDPKSSDVNQHNEFLIAGERTKCLVCQIVGPVCRRVVYWPPHDRPAPVAAGDRIGMMKFGSRLDLYLPRDDVTVVANVGDRVRAGETVVARALPHGGAHPADHRPETAGTEGR